MKFNFRQFADVFRDGIVNLKWNLMCISEILADRKCRPFASSEIVVYIQSPVIYMILVSFVIPVNL